MRWQLSIARFLQNLLPSGYQIKRTGINSFIRLVFLGLAFGAYSGLAYYIPDELQFRFEIAMVLTLTVSIIFFLPFFETFSHYLKSKFLSEYLSEDASISRAAYKRFDINSLIKSVFPDMVKISGSDSGRLGILKEDGTFDIYNFNRGRQKKIHTRQDNTPMNQLMQFLVNYPDGVSITETCNFPGINQDFVDLRADFIMPFLFREKIFGFLAVSSIPDTEAHQQIYTLSRQCALVIHNHNLSSHIVENLKYRQEEESAKRIQSLLQKGSPPKIPGFKISLTASHASTLVEFYQTQDENWNFLLLTAGGPPRSAGLVNSYILGLLFARLKKGLANNFIEVKKIVNQVMQKANWKDKYGYLIVKIEKDLQLEILHEGSYLKVFSENEPSIPLTSIGWKTSVTVDSLPVVVELRGKEFMRLEKA